MRFKLNYYKNKYSMRRFLLLLVSFCFFIFSSCDKPEKKLIGKWEYDSFEVDESGLGFLMDYLPEDWMQTIEEWLEKSKGISNSVYEFYPDATYKESFSGPVEGLTTSKGRFSLTRDYQQLILKTGESEYVMKLIQLTDTNFVYLKEFTKYHVPLGLRIKYKRILP